MKRFLRGVLIIAVIIWTFYKFIDSFKQYDPVITEYYPAEGCEEFSRTDPLTNDKAHRRSWRLINTFTDYCSEYTSEHAVSQQSKIIRDNFSPYGLSYAKYWGSLYEKLYVEDQPKIRFLADSLYEKGTEHQLSHVEMAELIVSFVQDIPYNYIKTTPCKNESKPCVGNTKYGILSPYEFIHTESGDCDTRAVLLFAMLEHLGYDPMIVISEKYLHAMLALHIPTSGDYLIYRKKKYYFWETTAKGWSLGDLPPSYANINYWNIALVK